MKIKESKELVKMIRFMDTLRDIRKVMIVHFTKKMKEHHLDITLEMLEVLFILWEKDNINQQEIVDKTSRKKASLTSLIDNLTSRGLVVRRQDPTDRRNNLIVLTKEGVAYQEKIIPLMEEVYQSVNMDISDEELIKVHEVLQRLYQKIKD